MAPALPDPAPFPCRMNIAPSSPFTSERQPGQETNTVRVLVIEDDAETASYILRGLHEHGHVADLAVDGRDGFIHRKRRRLRRACRRPHVARHRRINAGPHAPQLRHGVGDRVEGLDAGDDDYMVKPFAFAKLLARLNAL